MESAAAGPRTAQSIQRVVGRAECQAVQSKNARSANVRRSTRRSVNGVEVVIAACREHGIGRRVPGKPTTSKRASCRADYCRGPRGCVDRIELRDGARTDAGESGRVKDVCAGWVTSAPAENGERDPDRS